MFLKNLLELKVRFLARNLLLTTPMTPPVDYFSKDSEFLIYAKYLVHLLQMSVNSNVYDLKPQLKIKTLDYSKHDNAINCGGAFPTYENKTKLSALLNNGAETQTMVYGTTRTIENFMRFIVERKLAFTIDEDFKVSIYIFEHLQIILVIFLMSHKSNNTLSTITFIIYCTKSKTLFQGEV